MTEWTWLAKSEWMNRAACLTADPDAFFDELRLEEAQTYCEKCPVFDECDEFAWSERLLEDHDGVYAGKLPRTRRTEIRQRNRTKQRLRVREGRLF